MHQFSRTYSSASFKFVHFNQHSLVQVINNSSLFHKVTLFGLHIEVVVFSCSVVSSSLGLFVTPWTAACKASLSFTISQSLFTLMSIELVMPPTYLILCCPLSSCPQSFPASGSFPMSQLFTSGSQSIGVSVSVLPMNIQGSFLLELAGLIFLQFNGLQESFPARQFKSINSAFFMVQLSHPYVTTGKSIALTR